MSIGNLPSILTFEGSEKHPFMVAFREAYEADAQVINTRDIELVREFREIYISVTGIQGHKALNAASALINTAFGLGGVEAGKRREAMDRVNQSFHEAGASSLEKQDQVRRAFEIIQEMQELDAQKQHVLNESMGVLYKFIWAVRACKVSPGHVVQDMMEDFGAFELFQTYPGQDETYRGEVFMIKSDDKPLAPDQYHPMNIEERTQSRVTMLAGIDISLGPGMTAEKALKREAPLVVQMVKDLPGHVGFYHPSTTPEERAKALAGLIEDRGHTYPEAEEFVNKHILPRIVDSTGNIKKEIEPHTFIAHSFGVVFHRLVMNACDKKLQEMGATEPEKQRVFMAHNAVLMGAFPAWSDNTANKSNYIPGGNEITIMTSADRIPLYQPWHVHTSMTSVKSPTKQPFLARHVLPFGGSEVFVMVRPEYKPVTVELGKKEIADRSGHGLAHYIKMLGFLGGEVKKPLQGLHDAVKDVIHHRQGEQTLAERLGSEYIDIPTLDYDFERHTSPPHPLLDLAEIWRTRELLEKQARDAQKDPWSRTMV